MAPLLTTLPAAGAVLAGEDLGERGLAGAVAPDEADPVAGPHAKVGALE